MAYNITNLTESQGLYEMVVELNILSDYRFGIVLLVGLTLLFAITLIKSGAENYVAIMGSGVIMSVVAIFMIFTDILSPDIGLPFIIVAVLIGVIGYMLRN